MSDVDFILEILLRARDEASPVVDKLRAKLDELKGKEDATTAEKDLSRAIEDRGRKIDETTRKQERHTGEVEKGKRTTEAASEVLAKNRQRVDEAAGANEEHRKRLEEVRKAHEEATDKTKDYERELRLLSSASKSFREEINKGIFSHAQAKRGLKEYGTEIDSLSRRVERGGEAWREARNEVEKLDSYLKHSQYRATGGIIKSFKRGDISEGFEAIDAIGKKFDSLGLRISGVSSFLRGFFDLFKIGFAQQLITSLGSLAGGLFSVASAAGQAGAALAGVFASGMGQAIPMLSIIVASVERFKNILQAVSVAGQAEQQKFYDPTEKQVLQLQQASQLIGAQQQLSNSYIQLYEAQQRVKDSQIALTEARYNASRQTRELSIAEKEAKLAAEGANLGLIESRRRLEIAQQKGNIAELQQAELSVKQAELSKQKAEYTIPKAEREERLAKQRRVEGQPAVIAAREGAEAAKVALIQARQAGEAAKRQMQITELQQKARSFRETQFEAQLKFLKKGMSPTELGLTDALIGIEKELKSPSSPLKKITDYFVAPFTNAIETIRSLLKTSGFIKPVDELAKAMGQGLGRLEKATYGRKGTSFFEQMARDASKNIPIISKAIEKIMVFFEDVATAAGPAFHKLSEDWLRFWSGVDKKYEGTGLERLTDFFNKSAEYAERFAHLIRVLFDLFKALGHDAAPQGLKTVNSFAEAVERATKWAQAHGPEVTRFFSQAREGLQVIGELLFGIGASLVKVFSVESLKTFGQFIQQILLPAMRDVVEILGFITRWLLKIVNAVPGGKTFFEAIAAAFLGLEALVKVAGPIVKLISLFKELKYISIATFAVMKETGVVGALSNIGGAIDAIKAKYRLLRGESIATASTIEATSAAETAALSGVAAGETVTAGGVVLPAGVTAAEVAGGGLLAGLGRKALGAAPAGLGLGLAGYFGGKIIGGRTGNLVSGIGEGAGAGAVIGSVVPGIGTGIGALGGALTGAVISELSGPNLQESANQDRLKLLKHVVDELHGSLRNVPIDKLENIRKEAEALGKASGVGKAKAALEELSKQFSPSEIASRQWAEHLKEYMNSLNPAVRSVAESFKSIGESTQFIFKQIKETTKTNIESIKEDLGLNSKLGKEALAKNFGEAENAIYQAMAKGTVSTQKGMQEIRKLVSEALRKYGVSNTEIGGPYQLNPLHLTQSGQRHGGAARGDYISARPGGHLVPVGEGGHDEVVLSTDPRHADRSRHLLGQYFRAAPHLAIGGRIRDYPGPQGRVDQGVDFAGPGPVRAVLPGVVKSTGLWSGWPGTGGLVYGTVKGLIYIMENFLPTVRAKTRVLANQILGYDTGGKYGIETGWANALGTGPLIPYTPSQAAIDRAGGTASTAGGMSFARFLGTGEGGGAGGIFQGITSPLVRGGGAIGSVVQNALNLTTKAANIFLGKHLGASPAGVGSLYAGKLVPGIMNIAHRAASLAGLVWNSINEMTIRNLLGAESSGGINEPPSGPLSATGPMQIIPSTFRSYALPGHENIMDPEDSTDAAMRYIKARYGSIEGLESTVHPHPGYAGYAMGGLIGSHLRRMAFRHLRRKVLKFAQGGIAPWGGRPVPIIAHEGERVMNPAQYHETARLAGTSPKGLDRYLGYDSSPRQHFAAGGKVTPLGLPGTGSLTVGLAEIGSIESLMKIIKAITEGFAKIGKKKSPDKYKDEIYGFFVNMEKAFEAMNEGREYLKAKLSRGAISREYSEVGRFAATTSFGSGRVSGKFGVVKLGPGGEARIAEESLESLRAENSYLEKESKSLSDDRKKLSSDMKRAKSRTAKSVFRNEINSIAKKQKELGELVTSNIEARYQAETQILQDKVSEANREYQTFTQEQQVKVTSAQALGQLTKIGSFEEAIGKKALEQEAVLKPLLAQAQAIGNRELEVSIKQELSSLQQTVTNAIVEKISTAQTLIQRESGAAEAISGQRLAISKVLSAEGKYIPAGAEERLGLEEKNRNLYSVRSKEEGLLQEAREKEDIAAMITLGEELAKNTTEIAENNLAIKNNITVTRELTLGQIQREGQLGTGIYGAAKQGIELIAQTTGYMNVAGLLSAARGEGGVLSQEREGYERQGAELGFATEGKTAAQILAYLQSPEARMIMSGIETSGSLEEKQHMEKLISNLETNSNAILQNTEEIAKLNGQLNQPQSWSTTAWKTFRGAFFSGMGGLLPQYSSILPPGAAIPTEMPKYGEMAPGRSLAAPTIGNLNLTHPVERLDPQLLGEELSHAIGTAPSI